MNGLIYPSGLDSQYEMDDHNYMPCFDHGMFMAPLMSLNGPLRFSCQSLRPQAVDGGHAQCDGTPFVFFSGYPLVN